MGKTEHDWLTPAEIEPWVELARKWGVSEVALSSRGFWPAFKRARGKFTALGQDAHSGQAWRDRRNNFVARHLAQIKTKGEPLWVNGLPTPRHLALIIWAYTPDPEKLEAAVANIRKATSSRPPLRKNGTGARGAVGRFLAQGAQPSARLERQQSEAERQQGRQRPAPAGYQRIELRLVPLRMGKDKGWRVSGKVWDKVVNIDRATGKERTTSGIVGDIPEIDFWGATPREVQGHVARSVGYAFDAVRLDVRPEHEALWLNRRNPQGTTAQRSDPDLWEEVKAEVTAGSKGGRPGQWSARKAQLAVTLYKQRGGDYIGPKSPRNSLVRWTRQEWRTKSGRPSLETGERYLPKAAIQALSDREYAATTRAKRVGMRRGEQFVPQPEDVARKTRRYRNPLVRPGPEVAAIFRPSGEGSFLVLFDQLKLPAVRSAVLGFIQFEHLTGRWAPQGVDQYVPEVAWARSGYGPLLYDLTAFCLEEPLGPSGELSVHARAFWGRLGYKPIQPPAPSAFREKYGVDPLVLLARGAPYQKLASKLGSAGYDNYVDVDWETRMSLDSRQ